MADDFRPGKVYNYFWKILEKSVSKGWFLPGGHGEGIAV